MLEPDSDQAERHIEWGTSAARWIMLATVLGSGLAFLDATSSNVALPAIGEDLDAGLSQLQWTVNGYTLSMTALILLGGSLSDRLGRRRVFIVGTIWFAFASLLCGLAPSGPALIGARVLQGAGGALLTPVSLAIIQASFASEDRARAIGAWSGLSGIAAALGPMIGGWLIDVGSWRLIFLTNLPVAAVVIAVTARYVPESRDPMAAPGFDLRGVFLAASGLAALSWALIAVGERGVTGSVVIGGAIGLFALLSFIVVQMRSRFPMLPLEIFRARQFSVANLVTMTVYGAFSVMFFLLMIHLQQVLGYSPLQAGLAGLPITGIMLVFSAQVGKLAQRIGPRLPMTLGSTGIAAGLFLLAGLDAEGTYVTGVLPGLLFFGVGLALTVSPLTATVMASVEEARAGIASGVNNAISRGAGLVAIAVIPGIVGLTGDAYADPDVFTSGFRLAMLVSAGIALSGAALAALLIQDRLEGVADACPYDQIERQYHCPVDGAPIQQERKLIS